MKRLQIKIVTFVAVVMSAVACTEGDGDGQKESWNVVVDFEEAVLGELTLDGYNPTVYQNVLAGKAQATLCTNADNQLVGCMLFDDILYSEQGVHIGSFFSDFKELWGGTFDTTYAFVISANNNMEVATVHNQYSVYSATNDNNKFAVAYDGTWWSPTYQNRYGTYDLPTVEFDSAVTPVSVDVANTTYTYLQIRENDPNVCFAIKAVGYLDGEEGSSLSIPLAENGRVISDWTTVALTALGRVDKICFTVDWSATSSAVKAPEEWCPFSFCVDNLKIKR